MDARTTVKSELMAIKQTQAFKKRFDFTRKIIAQKDTAGKEVIPLTNEGPFLCTGYNIKFTKNSTVTRGGVTTNINRVGLRFTSESDNSAQSNDYVPVQLIATPLYIAPPVTPLLLVKVQLIATPSYIAPPKYPLLLVKVQLIAVKLPSQYTAPP